MSPLRLALVRWVGDIAAGGVEWALVGGIAVATRAQPRFTSDLDVVVKVSDDAAAERLVAFLRGRGYRLLKALEQVDARRLATVRLLPPADLAHPGLVVDVLFASSGIEPEVVGGADPLEPYPGVRVPVASRGHLLALKVLARDDERRPLDRADIVALLREAQPGDLAVARSALQLITARGFHRGKDLIAEFDTLVEQLREA
jgi:hypothetical protein